MKNISALQVIALIGCVALGAGCRKKIDPGSQEARESPDGRACPPAIGMISDCESNSNQTNTIQGRGGYWYTFVDKAGSSVTPTAGEQGGTFTMTEGGANGTKYAARMTGSIGGGDIVYAGMGLNFVDPKGQYDASKFKGISFWAKKGPGSTGAVRLKVPDKNTDPDGKVCTACFNDFGIDLQLTEQWTQYTVPFTSMKQIAGWGSPHTSGIVPSTIYGMQFQVNEKNSKFDIWVDEIQFTGCQ
jgi:endoglucanase